MPIPEDVIKEMFQSTRPHGRTRHSVSGAEFGFPVSIHAYSREDATRRTANPFPCGRFQSTRTRGRTRHERDARGGTRYTVSIHASSREDATIAEAWLPHLDRFQSTRTRGRMRRRIQTPTPDGSCFNPRVLAGGRDSMSRLFSSAIVFQSTRTRGRTRLSAVLRRFL